MKSTISGQFRVEARGDDRILTDHDRMAIDLGQDIDRLPHLLYPWGPDEHSVDRIAQAVDRDFGFERVDLTSKGIAAHHHVEDTELHLTHPICGCFGQENHPGARPQCRHPGFDALPQRFDESVPICQFADSRRLPARDHKGVYRIQISRGAHQRSLCSEALECRGVLAEVSLEGKDSDAQLVHQPRSCIRSSAGNLSISMPTIASPSPRETLATICGSSK